MAIREGLPLLAKHEGEWEGTYTHVDADGNVVDRHASHLSCLLSPEDPDRYVQVNRYRWEDGRSEEYTFPGVYDGHGRLYFDTERIKGVTWALDENAMFLTWRFKASDPSADQRLFEMIVLSDDGASRSRTWQWLEHGVCVRRTLIQETRVG
ncbi:hypothetical protein Ssi03_41230 [Sphaerisporangium siamense]|uniref:DUF3598 domain-containing protein n=1 Tax=Sphaerisporangium siamense TaxID=795645 RepID=A0A7W7DDB9_9ACTN|nr:DUF3598 family protein [Sphaerisporangium siamense]MBB4704521.1 hypothetical protein [Sphaerisporangium siamense]GII86133.1 hypothetical protein Ssi03_41230 [Sphaerisporangium siamense]